MTFRREIAPEVEANLLAIPRKQRAMVRKGIARQLRSEIDTRADRFFDLYADNQHRHGTPPQSRRYFDALLDVFGDDCEIAIVHSARKASRCRVCCRSTSATKCCRTTPAT